VIGNDQNKDKVQAAMDACDSILRDFLPETTGGSAKG
jgi:hypothetical protein